MIPNEGKVGGEGIYYLLESSKLMAKRYLFILAVDYVEDYQI
jgi:hypothetical protein